MRNSTVEGSKITLSAWGSLSAWAFLQKRKICINSNFAFSVKDSNSRCGLYAQKCSTPSAAKLVCRNCRALSNLDPRKCGAAVAILKQQPTISLAYKAVSDFKVKDSGKKPSPYIRIKTVCGKMNKSDIDSLSVMLHNHLCKAAHYWIMQHNHLCKVAHYFQYDQSYIFLQATIILQP